MADLRILREIRPQDGWDGLMAGLLAAFRARVADLGTTYGAVDEVSGLADGHTSKLLAPVPIKGLGQKSLGLLMGTLGIRILVVADDAAVEPHAARLTARKPGSPFTVQGAAYARPSTTPTAE